ncbi:MAG: DNA gyrase subunit A [Limisphaerales bacterium]
MSPTNICRLVIELKRDANPKVVIAKLFQHTQLEVSFSVNALAIDHGRPKTLNLKEIIQCYIEHRREVVLRRTRFELRKAEERAELLEGYIIALSNLDEFIHHHPLQQNPRRSTRQTAGVRVVARAGGKMGGAHPQRDPSGSGPLRADRAAGGCDFRTAFVSVDRPGN